MRKTKNLKSYSEIIEEQHAKLKATGAPPGSMVDITHLFTGSHVVIVGANGMKRGVKKPTVARKKKNTRGKTR